MSIDRELDRLPGEFDSERKGRISLPAIFEPPEPRVDVMWEKIAATRRQRQIRQWLGRGALVAAAAVLVVALELLRLWRTNPEVTNLPPVPVPAAVGDYEKAAKVLEATMTPYWALLPSSTAAPLRQSIADVRAAVSTVDQELLANPGSRGLLELQVRYRRAYCDLLSRAIASASASTRTSGLSAEPEKASRPS